MNEGVYYGIAIGVTSMFVILACYQINKSFLKPWKKKSKKYFREKESLKQYFLDARVENPDIEDSTIIQILGNKGVSPEMLQEAYFELKGGHYHGEKRRAGRGDPEKNSQDKGKSSRKRSSRTDRGRTPATSSTGNNNAEGHRPLQKGKTNSTQAKNGRNSNFSTRSKLAKWRSRRSSNRGKR